MSGYNGLVASQISAAGGALAANFLSGYVTANVVYNNTAALTNVAGMSVSVVASGIYDIEAYIQTTNVVKAIQVAFGGTATYTNVKGNWEAHWGVNNFTALNITAINTAFSSATLNALADAWIWFRGTIEVNAAGTLLLQSAQLTADASNSTLLRGSMMKLIKLN